MYALICTLVPNHQGFYIQEFSQASYPTADGFVWAEVEAEVDVHRYCGVQADSGWKIVPVIKPAFTVKQCEDLVQARLNEIAGSWGYTGDGGSGSIISALTYLGSNVPRFKAEAEALRDWRDQMWVWASQQLLKYMSGEMEVPTSEEALRNLMPPPPVRPDL